MAQQTASDQYAHTRSSLPEAAARPLVFTNPINVASTALSAPTTIDGGTFGWC